MTDALESTAVGEDEYEAVAEELVEAGLAERVDGDYTGLRATRHGRRGFVAPESELPANLVLGNWVS